MEVTYFKDYMHLQMNAHDVILRIKYITQLA